MPDFSETHDACGFLWIPKAHEEPAPPAKPLDSHLLDQLDLPRLYVKLQGLLRYASDKCDSPQLTADERQFWSGVKHGLKSSLKLFEPQSNVPPPAETGLTSP